MLWSKVSKALDRSRYTAIEVRSRYTAIEVRSRYTAIEVRSRYTAIEVRSRYTAIEVSLFSVEFSISDVNSVKAFIVE